MLAATSPATGGDVDRQALKLVPFVGPTDAPKTIVWESGEWGIPRHYDDAAD